MKKAILSSMLVFGAMNAIVDNAVIDDVTLCVAKESSLDVQDGSEIRLRSGSNLFLPRGCSATLKNGTIKNMK